MFPASPLQDTIENIHCCSCRLRTDSSDLANANANPPQNHQFMPITDSRLFCTWEVFDGTDQKVLQDYLDQTMFTKACCNALIPLNRKYNPDPNACATKTSEAVPYDGGSGANGCFLVKHYVRRDDAGAQGKAFWAKLMSGMADPDLFASWTKAQADLKLLNHIWFPVHDAFVICLWEADQSVENAAGVLQDYLDNDLGRGEHPAGVLQDYLDNDLGRGEHPAGVLQDYLDNDLRGNTGLKITVGSP